MMRLTKTLLLTLLIAFTASGWAQENASEAERIETERRQVFQAGFATIVESLNLGTFELFASSINQDDFVNRIFGLRLIDQKIKRDFNDNLEYQFDGLIRSSFPDAKDNASVRLLGIESRGTRGRALVRFDLPKLQFNYHEYELALDQKNNLVVVDWIDYKRGDKFTDRIGNSLVMALPSQPAARKMIDLPVVSDADLFQFTELLKSARDVQLDRYVEIIKRLNPEVQAQRSVVLMSVQLAWDANNRRFLRSGLLQMAKHFPEEPLFSLALLDYYVPGRKYEAATAALQRTYAKFGFDDAAMEARISAINLAAGNSEDAAAFAERAVSLEPGLELAWWSALRARVAVEDYSGSVEALQRLEQQYGILWAPTSSKVISPSRVFWPQKNSRPGRRRGKRPGIGRDVNIVEFKADYAEAFQSLNLEWLEAYFHVEEIDRTILSDPESEVIAHGGHILFAEVDDGLVGTVALKHHGDGKYELTKMAVTASAQGQGFGRSLMLAAIERFESIDGKNLFLETHSSLATAINLYESAGFEHASHPTGSDYARSDTYMIYRSA
jgi:putative acetyltransferase